MNWLLIFISILFFLGFSFLLWIRLVKVLDQNGVIYTSTIKQRILWEILFQIMRLAVLSLVVHWVLKKG